MDCGLQGRRAGQRPGSRRGRHGRTRRAPRPAQTAPEACADCAGSLSLFYLVRMEAGFLLQERLPRLPQIRQRRKSSIAQISITQFPRARRPPVAMSGFTDVNGQLAGMQGEDADRSTLIHGGRSAQGAGSAVRLRLRPTPEIVDPGALSRPNSPSPMSPRAMTSSRHTCSSTSRCVCHSRRRTGRGRRAECVSSDRAIHVRNEKARSLERAFCNLDGVKISPACSPAGCAGPTAPAAGGRRTSRRRRGMRPASSRQTS